MRKFLRDRRQLDFNGFEHIRESYARIGLESSVVCFLLRPWTRPETIPGTRHSCRFDVRIFGGESKPSGATWWRRRNALWIWFSVAVCAKRIGPPQKKALSRERDNASTL